MMHQELVERRRRISERRFPHTQLLHDAAPEPEVQQLATYLVWLMHGTWGGRHRNPIRAAFDPI